MNWTKEQIKASKKVVQHYDEDVIPELAKDVYNSDAWRGNDCEYCKIYYIGDACSNQCPLVVLNEGCNKQGSVWRKMVRRKNSWDIEQAIKWAKYIRGLAAYVAGMRKTKPRRPE